MRGLMAVATGLVLFGLGTTPSRAGEEEQAALCRGDVMRLCMSEIPDRTRIVACMRVKRASLSPGCRAAFDGGGGTQASQRTATLR